MKLSEQINGRTEDLVAKYKGLLYEFGKIQDMYFEELKEKTGIRGGKEEDYLFDHVFNSGENESFSEYLHKLGQ